MSEGSQRPEAPTAPLLRFESVIKRYQDVPVLEGFDFRVAPSERVTLIGPSGSGKTTVLRIAMGLEAPTSGAVDVGGQPLWRVMTPGGANEVGRRAFRAAQLDVGMVFQAFNLFPHMTVLRNITAAPQHVLGTDAEEARARAGELLELVGLAGLESRYPSQLSGGQQQRVAIARAMAMRPRLLLLDEITSALDPEVVGEVLRAIRDISDTTQTALLVVTHEMRFAAEASDRIIMMDQGHIVETGPPETVLRSPREERTRTFLERIL